MCEPIPGYDLWKLDNGPYENDGYVPYENLDDDVVDEAREEDEDDAE